MFRCRTALSQRQIGSASRRNGFVIGNRQLPISLRRARLLCIGSGKGSGGDAVAAGLPLFSARVLGGIFVPGEMRLLSDRRSPVPLRCRPLSRACVSICGVIAAAAAADPCRLGRRKGVWQQRKCHEFKGRKLGRRAGGHGRPRCGSWIRQRWNSHVAERVFFKGNWWRILAAAGQDGARVVCEWGRGTGIVARCSPRGFCARIL